MTRYYVDISTELVKEIDENKLPVGWRLVSRWGPRDRTMERWIVEDDHAPADLEDYLVEVSFSYVAGQERAIVNNLHKRDLP